MAICHENEQANPKHFTLNPRRKCSRLLTEAAVFRPCQDIRGDPGGLEKSFHDGLIILTTVGRGGRRGKPACTSMPQGPVACS